MNDFNADGPSENEWEEQGELGWNEFDWEKYLREQDEAISRYLAFYEKLKGHSERIDETARLMGWEEGDWSADAEDEPAETDLPGSEATTGGQPADYENLEPYTLHKNPVFIATKAIYLSLARSWSEIAVDAARVPQPLALAFQVALHRGEEQSGLAIQALDLGDYAMAVSLFKRALRELNASLALIDDAAAARHPALGAFRDSAWPRLFDLREIWLRVINECRDELARHIDEEN
ncbi:MAG TPA: hypothetical protein VG838_16635 [Opitutaceae bacterium]|nr:hypothetical protein [Opitutaceae bacterium]